MALTAEHAGFDWGFLESMGRWTLRTAALAGVLGGLVARDWRFTVSCMLGAAIDVVLLERVAHRGRASIEARTFDAGLVGLFLGERLLAKAVLLVGAFLFPVVLSFWGMVAGVVAFDATLLLVGSTVAAWRTMRGAPTDDGR